jgi:putative mRNA 3-end processing factor
MTDVVTSAEHGLFCAAGGFHVDPWSPVELAVVTHAHADHARAGSGAYLCARIGAELVRNRVGPEARVETLEYGERRRIGEATVSLHPAGHVLGSAQVRIEAAGETWVVSGDYKTEPDPTCAPLEPQRCDVFVTESTFGLPIFRWEPAGRVIDEVERWWGANREARRTSVLYAYSLGKAQRVLASIDASAGPVLVHGAMLRPIEAYRAAGIALPEVLHVDDAAAREHRGRALVLAPPSAAGTPWLRKLAPASHAFVSGWMRLRGPRRRMALDRGFALSDHADWPGLLATIEAAGARRVLASHGAAEPLARWLAERGLEAGVLRTQYGASEDAGA